MTVEIQVKPLYTEGDTRQLGAFITGVDCENLTDADFTALREALYTHQVIIIKDQHNLTPAAQYALANRFDPPAQSYGHGATLSSKSILHPDLHSLPSQPQVQVLGNGFLPSYLELRDKQLRHPSHTTFHSTTIPVGERAKNGQLATRFYRWHIDAALYELNPPMVTTLYAVQIPDGERQTIRYDDESGDEIADVPLGSTAFASGYAGYEALNEEEKEFVRTTKVEYAPHPYVWMSSAKSRSNGLGMLSEGTEQPLDKLPPFVESKIQILPMVWKNPVTGKLALIVHPSAVRKLHLKDGSVLEDLKEVRERVYGLQRRMINPERVYCHDWKEGDLCVFNNRGVLHSVTGTMTEEMRVFRQCNVAASCPPVGPDME